MAKLELKEIAEKYKDISLQIKELEKVASPLKKQLTDYAKRMGLEKSLEIGGLTIECRTGEKVVFQGEKITPDWLYRAQNAGIRLEYKISIPDAGTGIGNLLDEIGYSSFVSKNYAIRL